MSSSEHHSGRHEEERSGPVADFQDKLAKAEQAIRAIRGEETKADFEEELDRKVRENEAVHKAFELGKKERTFLKPDEVTKLNRNNLERIEDMLRAVRGGKPTTQDRDFISAWFAGKQETGWVKEVAKKPTRKEKLKRLISRPSTDEDRRAEVENKLNEIEGKLRVLRLQKGQEPGKPTGAHGSASRPGSAPASARSGSAPESSGGVLRKIARHPNLGAGIILTVGLAAAIDKLHDRFGRKGGEQKINVMHVEGRPEGLESGDFSELTLGGEIFGQLKDETDKKRLGDIFIKHVKELLDIRDLSKIDADAERKKLIAGSNSYIKDKIEKDGKKRPDFETIMQLSSLQRERTFGVNSKGLDPFFWGKIRGESNGDQYCISKKKETGEILALGVMQIAPGEECAKGGDLNDPAFNIQAGFCEYKKKVDQYGGSFAAASMAYNGGVGMFADFIDDYNKANGNVLGLNKPASKLKMEEWREVLRKVKFVDLYSFAHQPNGEVKWGKGYRQITEYVMNEAVFEATFAGQLDSVLHPGQATETPVVAGETPKPGEKTEQKADDQEDDLVEPSADDTATAPASETTMIFKDDPLKASVEDILGAEIVSPPGMRQKGHHSQSEWKMILEQERRAQYKDKWDFNFDNLRTYAKQMAAWFKEGGVSMTEADALVQKYSQQFGVPYELVSANVIANFNAEKAAHAPQAGSVSAIGPMQVTPEALSQYNKSRPTTKVKPEDLYTVDANFKVGVWQLRYLDDMFGQWNLALKAKKFGVGAVIKWLNERTSGDTKITEQDFSVFDNIPLAQRALHSDFEHDNSVSAPDKAKLKQLRERILALHKKIADSGATLEDVPGARKYVLETASFVSVGKTLFHGDKLQLWYPEEWQKGGSNKRPVVPPPSSKPAAPASTAYGGQRVQPRGRG